MFVQHEVTCPQMSVMPAEGLGGPWGGRRDEDTGASGWDADGELREGTATLTLRM